MAYVYVLTKTILCILFFVLGLAMGGGTVEYIMRHIVLTIQENPDLDLTNPHDKQFIIDVTRQRIAQKGRRK
jgi:hypothetical protein